MTLLNKKATRSYILNKWEALRPGHKIDRVSQDAIEKLDARLRNYIIQEIKCHPSVGVTFKI